MLAYVLHKFDKDHPHNLVCNNKLHDALSPCIQHLLHKLWWSRDFDIFHEYMQGGQDIQDQLYIRVFLLKNNKHASVQPYSNIVHNKIL